MVALEEYFTSKGFFTKDKQRENGIMNLVTEFIAPKSTNIDKNAEVGQKNSG